MNIDWASLVLVAITTVVAAIAIVGIFSLGVAALTSGGQHKSGRQSRAKPTQPGRESLGTSVSASPGCWCFTGCT